MPLLLAVMVEVLGTEDCGLRQNLAPLPLQQIAGLVVGIWLAAIPTEQFTSVATSQGATDAVMLVAHGPLPWPDVGEPCD